MGVSTISTRWGWWWGGGGSMCGHKGDQEAPEVKQIAVAMVGVIGRVTRIHAEAVAVEKMFTPGC